MKYYSLKFGAGDPRTYSGMNATFLYFVNMTTGATLTPPAITESLTGSGVYQFQWGTTLPIAFLADAATTSPGTALRYITGELDPVDRADEYGVSIVALGTSGVALGTSNFARGTSIYAIGVSNYAMGTTAFDYIETQLVGVGIDLASVHTKLGTVNSLIGDTVSDPVDIYGYLKRVDALVEGREQFVKSTGVFTMYDKTGATTLSTRTISNSASLVTKT